MSFLPEPCFLEAAQYVVASDRSAPTPSPQGADLAQGALIYACRPLESRVVWEGHRCQAQVVAPEDVIDPEERAVEPDVRVHVTLKQPLRNPQKSPKRCALIRSAIPSAKKKDTRQSVFGAGMDTCATVRAVRDRNVQAFFAPLAEPQFYAVVESVVFDTSNQH